MSPGTNGKAMGPLQQKLGVWYSVRLQCYESAKFISTHKLKTSPRTLSLKLQQIKREGMVGIQQLQQRCWINFVPELD